MTKLKWTISRYDDYYNISGYGERAWVCGKPSKTLEERIKKEQEEIRVRYKAIENYRKEE